MMYFVAWSLFLIYFKLYLNFKVIGRENVPKQGAFIFASNHASYLDPILLGTSVYRSLNYMARASLFRTPLFSWMMKEAHAFPVNRSGSDLSAVKEAFNTLKKGRPLVIFPEGTRSNDRSLRHGKPGIGFIVARAKVPVVPAYIEGSFEAMPAGAKKVMRYPVKVYIGKPITFSDEFLKKKDKHSYQRISDEIMRRITLLKEERASGAG